MTDFDIRLDKHLKKCEIEFSAKESQSGRCIPWLAPYCDNTEQIAVYLRKLGFRINRIVSEKEAPDGSLGWVETTGGFLVFTNLGGAQGFVAKTTARSRE